MAKAKGEQIWVWLDDPLFGPLQHIGTLSRGDRGSVRFAYEPAWLKHAHAFPLDPELDLFAGEFFPGNSNFGVFMAYQEETGRSRQDQGMAEGPGCSGIVARWRSSQGQSG